jgi:uncharacterized protein (TIGR02588 family)
MTNQNNDAAPDESRRGETSGQMTPRTDDKSLTIAEWTTLAISAAILVGIVGMITWLSFRGDEHPPMVTVEANLEDVRQEDSGYYLPIVIRNEGDDTIEDATVRGELDSGSGQAETVDLTVTFLSGGEEVRGTVVFQDDPTEGELTLAVTSYKEP